MSRLGRKPLPIPDKVKVEFKDGVLEISGPLGKLIQPIDKRLTVKIESNAVTVGVADCSAESGMLHGLVRGLIKNAFEGVTKGYKKVVEVQGLGYKASADAKNLTMSLGFSHPVNVSIPEGIKLAIDKQTLIAISGVDKAQVGEFAASIRAIKKPEPYKGTGIRYQGEHIIKKAGKAAAVGAAGGAGGGAGKK